ncbi:MAG: hypothetical protein AB8B56_01580 [Crocinitomicaceae bacterium]
MAKPLLKPNQCALIKCKGNTGQVLTENGDFHYTSDGELPYIIFDSGKKALEYAESSIKENSNLEFTLFNTNLTATHRINTDGIEKLCY